MNSTKSIEDEVFDRLMQKLKADVQISSGLVSNLEELRREGDLGRADKLLEAYRQGVRQMPLISRLDVAAFRGIPAPGTSLIFDNKSILLFGENGTGKSSFVDAIEKLLCGRVATLDGRAQNILSDLQGPHIRAGQSGPAISIVF